MAGPRDRHRGRAFGSLLLERPPSARARVDAERPGCARPTACSSARTSTSPRRRALVPYLRELGVSHLYLSPVLQARAGSTHGYDVVDPTRLSEELGGEARVPRARRGRAWPIDPRLRPQPHGRSATRTAGGATRSCASASSTSTPPGGYRRFFDIDELAAVRQERRGGVRDLPREGPGAVRRGPDRRPAHRPPRRSRRPARLPRAAARGAASSASGSRRSSSRRTGSTLRDWPVRARSATSSSTTPAPCSSIRPPASALTELLHGGHRRDPLIRRDRPRGPARAGAWDRSRRELARLQRLGPFGERELAQAPGGAAGLPHLRRAVERARRGSGP